MQPNVKVTQTWYNAMNEAVLSQDADGNYTATAYNAVGDVVATVDGAGDVTRNGYDGDDEEISTADGDGHVTQFAYNADGQQISETDADGNVTQYLLDGLGDVVATVDPLGDVTQAVCSLNGQVVSQTDADGRTLTYAYDNNGNLLTETDYNADGTVQDIKSFSYDPNGNVLTASNGYGTYTYTYDNNGNVKTQTDPFNLTLTYGYDGNGNVNSITDSLGGTTTKFYDAASQLTNIQFSSGTTQARLDLTYTKDGQLSTLTRYQDTAGTQLVGKSSYSYDSAGNVTEIKHTNASGGSLGDYVYSYDAANRLSSETDTENGGSPVTTNYSYDQASQLTQAGTSGYSYDSNGNRTLTGYLTGPGNRLLSDGTWDYSYDADGNTIRKTNIATGEYWTFAWNDANQLTLASDYQSNGTLIQSVTLKYDVFGNLVEQDTYTASNRQTAVVKYAYDADGNIWADLNSSNQLVDRRLFVDVNGQTQPFVRIDSSGNVAWYLTDQLGSVRLLTDNTSTIFDQIDYDAYGNITKETNAINGDRYKYASGQYNATLGMYQFGLRWLNPANGSWLNADPLGLAAGANPYDYAGNDPTNAVDPTGLYEKDVHYYLTYFLGLAAGLPAKDAYEVALGDQLTDLHPLTSPLPEKEVRNLIAELRGKGVAFNAEGMPVRGLEQKMLPANVLRRNLYIHFRTNTLLGKVEANSAVSKQIVNLALNQKGKDNFLMGIGLHIYQDSWSHQGYNFIAGHALAGHRPDRPELPLRIAANPQRKTPQAIFLEMAGATYDSLVQYRQKFFGGAAGLNREQAMAVSQKIIDAYLENRADIRKAGLGGKGEAARENLRGELLKQVVEANTRFKLQVFPTGVPGANPEASLEEAQRFDTMILGDAFTKAVRKITSPLGR